MPSFVNLIALEHIHVQYAATWYTTGKVLLLFWDLYTSINPFAVEA